MLFDLLFLSKATYYGVIAFESIFGLLNILHYFIPEHKRCSRNIIYSHLAQNDMNTNNQVDSILLLCLFRAASYLLGYLIPCLMSTLPIIYPNINIPASVHNPSQTMSGFSSSFKA